MNGYGRWKTFKIFSLNNSFYNSFVLNILLCGTVLGFWIVADCIVLSASALKKEDSAGQNYLLWSGNVLNCVEDEIFKLVKSVQEVVYVYSRAVFNGVEFNIS